MKILLDPKAGFCNGVKRVISMAEEIIEEKGEVFSLGEIIHNHEESVRLEKMGMKVVDMDLFEDPERYKNKSILIRAHGSPDSTFYEAQKYGLNLVNGTCPVVTRSQKLAKEYYNKNYQIVIVGKVHHPEVIGILGYCDNQAVVVYDEKDMENIDYSKKTFVLAQTTIPEEKFETIITIMQKKINNLEVKNTICKFVLGRDKQLQEFVQECDAVIMVGGRHSSNTKWLYDVCQEVNKNSYWIEDKQEIDFKWIKNKEIIGVTGSASTPQWLLEEVKEHLESKINV